MLSVVTINEQSLYIQRAVPHFNNPEVVGDFFSPFYLNMKELFSRIISNLFTIIQLKVLGFTFKSYCFQKPSLS